MKKRIYLLPSLFTLGNLVCGFVSIVLSFDKNFSMSAWLIILAGLFDLLDGKVARLTDSVSQFGVELDSLCDMVTFGVAPIFLIYSIVLFRYGRVGIVISVFYVVAVALRLARFNSDTLNGNNVSGYFKGLPCPSAAYILSSFVLIDVVIDNNITKKIIPFIMRKFYIFSNLIPLIIILLSFAMISNISYFSLKNLKIEKAKTFKTMILCFVGGILIYRFPENMIFIIFLLYFLSGIFDIFKKIKKSSTLIKRKG